MVLLNGLVFRDELLKHVDQIHKHATYICPYCPKTFTGQRFGQYTRHQETHLVIL